MKLFILNYNSQSLRELPAITENGENVKTGPWYATDISGRLARLSACPMASRHRLNEIISDGGLPETLNN